MSTGETETVVTLRRRDGYAFEAHLTGGPVPDLVVDEPPPIGEGGGPDAAGLLAGAIGHCLSSSLLFCLGKAGIEVGSLEVRVAFTKVRNPAGRLRLGGVRVTLAPELRTENPARFRRCLEIFQDYCTVTGSVKEGMAVDVAVEPVPPLPPAA